MKTELVIYDTPENSKNGMKKIFVALSSIFLLDMVWFSLSKNMYKNVVQDKVRRPGAFVAWFLMACALSVQNPKSMKEAITYGALVGLVIYGVFNGTTYAINKDWSLNISLSDTLWGITNCTITSAILFKVSKRYA